MIIDFPNVLLTVLSLVVLAIPGFLMAKLKMFPENATNVLSTVVLYCCQTFIVFMSFQNYSFSPEIGLNMLWVALLALLIHSIMIAIVCIFVKGKNEAKVKCVRYGSVFSNCAYIGIPLIKMLFEGSTYQGEVLIYTAIVITVWNILNWTVGVYIVTKDKSQIAPRKILFNPVIISVLLGLICFLVIKQPIANVATQGTFIDSMLEKLMTSCNYLGNAVTPLSMIVIGMRLSNVNLKQLFMDKYAYLQVTLKLVVMSLVCMLIVAFLPVAVSVKYGLFFTLSMPAATSTTLFAVKFNGDGDFASVCVLLSTILSILTIPLMFLLFSQVFGVVI